MACGLRASVDLLNVLLQDLRQLLIIFTEMSASNGTQSLFPVMRISMDRIALVVKFVMIERGHSCCGHLIHGLRSLRIDDYIQSGVLL